MPRTRQPSWAMKNGRIRLLTHIIVLYTLVPIHHAWFLLAAVADSARPLVDAVVEKEPADATHA